MKKVNGENRHVAFGLSDTASLYRCRVVLLTLLAGIYGILTVILFSKGSHILTIGFIGWKLFVLIGIASVLPTCILAIPYPKIGGELLCLEAVFSSFVVSHSFVWFSPVLLVCLMLPPFLTGVIVLWLNNRALALVSSNECVPGGKNDTGGQQGPK